MANRILRALATVATLTMEARGAIVEIPYQDWAATLQSQLDEVSVTAGLSLAEVRFAERTAGTWVYLGPCHGSVNDLNDKRADVVGMMTLRPKMRTGAATLQMIALINLQDLGRGSSEYICRFALRKANSG